MAYVGDEIDGVSIDTSAGGRLASWVMAGRERLSAVLRGVATYALLCLGSYFFGSSLVRAMSRLPSTYRLDGQKV